MELHVNSSLISCIETSKMRRNATCPYLLEALLYPFMQVRNVCEAPKRVVELGTRRPSRYIPEFVSDLSFSPDGILLAAATGEHLHLYDPNRGKIKHTVWDAHGKSSISTLTFTGDRKFVCGDNNGGIGIWDVRKFKEPLNTFRAHSQRVNRILHVPDLDWLLTSDNDGQVFYWYLPAYEVKDVQLEKDLHCGMLLNCPLLNQMCIAQESAVLYGNKQFVMTSKNGGSLYIIENLDLRHLANDIDAKNVCFNENLKLYLAMNPSLASFGKRNRIRYVDEEDFIPVSGASISNFSHIECIPNTLLMLMRCTTKKTSFVGAETKDWTICARLNPKKLQFNNLLRSFSIGSNVLDESLLYATEEPRFATLKEKRGCVSRCSRIIASPHKLGVRLLSFTPNLLDIESAILKRQSIDDATSFFWPTTSDEMNTVTLMKSNGARGTFPLCCKFSPIDLLLAVGDNNGNVSFYQPKL